MNKRQKTWPLGLILLLLTVLVLQGGYAKQAAIEGLRLCGRVLIPSLFPFSVLVHLFLSLGYAQDLGRLLGKGMVKVFSLPGACASALVLGLLGGYPIGSQAVAQLYSQGSVTRSQAQTLSAFTNNAGPGFILGVVGLGVLGSPALGMVLWLIHGLAAITAGILLARPCAVSVSPVAKPLESSLTAAFPGAMARACGAMVQVCGFVVFFTILTTLFSTLGPVGQMLSRLPQGLKGSLWGILELSSGTVSLTGLRQPLAFWLCAGLLGWGGLCVHSQALAFLLPAGLEAKTYLQGKALHALFSLLMAAPIAVMLWGRPWLPAVPLALLPFAAVGTKKLIRREKKGRNSSAALV